MAGYDGFYSGLSGRATVSEVLNQAIATKKEVEVLSVNASVAETNAKASEVSAKASEDSARASAIQASDYIDQLVSGLVDIPSDNVDYLYPDGTFHKISTLADNINPLLGASGIGYKGRTVSAKLAERIDVTDFRLIGDTSWSDAIDRAVAVAESNPSTTTFPYVVPKIWFPRTNAADGSYDIIRPIFCTKPLQFDGDGVRIVTKAGFTGKTIPLASGGTEVSMASLIFLSGKKGDITGTVQWGAEVGSGIVFDNNYINKPSIYIERMAYSKIACASQNSGGAGFEVGALCWGLLFDSPVVENFQTFGIHLQTNSAANGLAIRSPRIWGEFTDPIAGISFSLNAEANGVSITGGFIEKVTYGVLVSGGNGPINISGTDFEQCQSNVIRAAGDPAGKLVGPITVNNCFLHSVIPTVSKVFSSHAKISVNHCKLYPGTNDFETAGTGSISAIDNIYLAGVLGVAGSLSYESSSSNTKELRNYLPQKNVTPSEIYSIKNFGYKDSAFLESSRLAFSGDYPGDADGTYNSTCEISVGQYKHILQPGTIYNRTGIRMGTFANVQAVQPVTDGTISLGSASNRWSQVFALTPTINVSDGDLKDGIRDISEVEAKVAKELRGLVKAYKFKDAIAEKGEDKARTHFGWIAQEVKEVFERAGLDPFEYALLCWDSWDDVYEHVKEVTEVVLAEQDTEAVDKLGRKVTVKKGEPMLDEKGLPYTRVVTEAHDRLVTPAGSRYGVRYEELLAFIISQI